MKVFISHSTADKWVARKVAEDLDRLSITTFLDEKDIQTGESIDASISPHLADSDHFLILLSPASVNSHWVLIELGGAIALKKHLVPVLLYLGANDIPKPITRFLARDINDLHKYYEELTKRPAQPPPKPKLITRKVPIGILKKLTTGTRVRIMTSSPTLTNPAETVVGWNDKMDAFLSNEARIVGVERLPEGITAYRLDIDGGEFIWLGRWLTPIKVA